MMFVRTLPFALVTAACLFGGAGVLEVPRFAIYVAMVWLMPAAIYTTLARRSPDLVKERFRPPSDRDRVSRFSSMTLVVGHWLLAGLDRRFGWSEVPLPLVGFGLTLTVFGLALVGWTLLSNPYASTAVRVQSDRAQRVISSGPYRFVRHPMYLGVLVFAIGSPLGLGSFVAAAPVLLVLVVFARRTLVEDRMLQVELDGYAAYAERVRWRVVPGVF